MPPGDHRSGYSGTTLVRKLGVKPGQRVVLVGAPVGWAIEDLPDGVQVSRAVTAAHAEAPARAEGRYADLVVAFFPELAVLRSELPPLAGAIVANGSLWATWPRRAGGHRSDITDNDVRAVALPLGLVDVKVAALDTDWSGLKLVWRKERRARLATA